MYNNSSTLTDHILTSDEQSGMTTGSIIDDLSDHLITFCQLKFKNLKKKTKENLWSWLHLHWKDFLATDNVTVMIVMNCFGLLLKCCMTFIYLLSRLDLIVMYTKLIDL
jgi:hypothetical protein